MHDHTSTVKKSAAAIEPQWLLRNVGHGIRCRRSGAGTMPCSFRMLWIVPRDAVCPRLNNAPRIVVYPQPGFSRAIRTVSFGISSATRGRPGPLLAAPSYFMAISLRCQAKTVFGVTMDATSRSTLLPNTLPFTAKRRRSSSVNRIRLSFSFDLRILFSSWMYAITSS